MKMQNPDTIKVNKMRLVRNRAPSSEHISSQVFRCFRMKMGNRMCATSPSCRFVSFYVV